jgi:hypothetical protein
MYLPDQLSDQLRHATLRQANGQMIPLIQNEQTLFAAQEVISQPAPFMTKPNVVFTLFGIIITVFTIGRHASGNQVDSWLDRFLFGMTGLFGWFLLVLWLIRDDAVTAWNPSLLFLMPFHIPLVYWATRTNAAGKLRARSFGITAIFILAGMALTKIPGCFDVIYPLMLLVRCLINCYPVQGGSQTLISRARLKRAFN